MVRITLATAAESTTARANIDADMFIFYNQIKSVPGFLIEPYYILYSNRYRSADNRGAGLGTPKHSNQTRHNVGNRIEMRKGNFDLINETVYQFGQMGDIGGVNAIRTGMATKRTSTSMPGRPETGSVTRIISRPGNRGWHSTSTMPQAMAGRTVRWHRLTAHCTTANTFENMFPTNHIHMGYMDVQAWKNMMSPSANFQARPTTADHIEVWYTNLEPGQFEGQLVSWVPGRVCLVQGREYQDAHR